MGANEEEEEVDTQSVIEAININDFEEEEADEEIGVQSAIDIEVINLISEEEEEAEMEESEEEEEENAEMEESEEEEEEEEAVNEREVEMKESEEEGFHMIWDGVQKVQDEIMSSNGFGAIIGKASGMVLDYSTCNRKYKKCDTNSKVPDHDCHKNFDGSAKAMEPYVVKKLVVDSSILKSQNVEVGVLIGDSSTITACRAASDHPIIKQSDTNHTAGGMKKRLYGIQKNHKELTKNCITYLHRCFTYVMAQRDVEDQLARWIERLQRYDFEIHHRKDLCHGNADGLSRRPFNAVNAAVVHQLVVFTSSSTQKSTLLTAVEFEKHYEMDVTEEDNDENAIILLDLKTSGFEMNCDILQIGAKYNKNSFSIYVNPVRDISENATRVNGFTTNYGELLYHGTKV
ncbi:uncharacterized protein LOC116852417 [Odontomachus brunneus]|uniref:uncharacterized protein LOC116852417 n=1 Tax=Odontomachus brunneus TaxID=486640 RepID=UPI0013F21277|nr:uncharacterized protein LOC116852417 [Odontomachus brunneus]